MKLIFVYNANSGGLNAIVDSAHKILSPSTYDCNLCNLTYGTFKEEPEWKEFRNSVAIPFVFLHKDEFLKAYKSKWLPKYDFPVVLVEKDGQLEIAVTNQDLTQTETLEELINRIKGVVRVFKTSD